MSDLNVLDLEVSIENIADAKEIEAVVNAGIEEIEAQEASSISAFNLSAATTTNAKIEEINTAASSKITTMEGLKASAEASSTSASSSAALALQYKNEAFDTTPAGYAQVVTTVNQHSETIAEVESNIYPTSYKKEALTYTNCAWVEGGYAKIGNLVVVNIRVTASTNGDISVGGFPTFANFTQSTKTIIMLNVGIASDYTNVYGYMVRSGVATVKSVVASKDYIISGTYLSTQ